MANVRLSLFRVRLLQLLDVVNPDDLATKAFNALLFSLVTLNIVAVVLERAVFEPLLSRFSHYLDI